jgi:hypothetical protein
MTSMTKSGQAASHSDRQADNARVVYKSVRVGNLDIFYREAGSKDASRGAAAGRIPDELADVPQPHPKLADNYHVVAPDTRAMGTVPCHREISSLIPSTT